MSVRGNYVRTEEHRKKMSQIQRGRHHSEEARKRMSEARRGNKNFMYGKHHTEEARRKISEARKLETEEIRIKRGTALKGKHLSEETKRKISKTHIGKHHTEKTRKKLSEVLKGRIGVINSNWRGGMMRGRDGRISLYKPDHPRAKNGKYVLRSHIVWESHHGPLPEGFIIHHRNGDYLDDRIENLECITQAEHIRLHCPEKSRGCRLTSP